jgi:hypothetical protein
MGPVEAGDVLMVADIFVVAGKLHEFPFRSRHAPHVDTAAVRDGKETKM